MPHMFLDDLERTPPEGPYRDVIGGMEAAGYVVPQIMRLLAFKPAATRHLCRYSQEVMRGPSPLSAGFRELIAAYTSGLNHCPF